MKTVWCSLINDYNIISKKKYLIKPIYVIFDFTEIILKKM